MHYAPIRGHKVGLPYRPNYILKKNLNSSHQHFVGSIHFIALQVLPYVVVYVQPSSSAEKNATDLNSLVYAANHYLLAYQFYIVKNCGHRLKMVP